jgi:hypothetical protein
MQKWRIAAILRVAQTTAQWAAVIAPHLWLDAWIFSMLSFADNMTFASFALP